jgi:hypothetical protein
MLKFILKLVAVPFALVFTIVAAVLNFLLSVSAIFFGIVSSLVLIGAVVLFAKGEPAGGIAFLAFAFLVSPFGIPALVGWLAGLLNSAGDALRGFIIG